MRPAYIPVDSGFHMTKCYFTCSSTTSVTDSPFLISAEDAQQTLNSALDDGEAEPLSDSSNIFFFPNNQYTKSKL